MMYVKMTVDECSALALMLTQQGVVDPQNYFKPPFIMEADGTVTILDEVEADVKRIMSDPNWRTTGAHANLIGYADTVRREKEDAPISVGGSEIAMDPVSRTESLVISMAAGTGTVLVNSYNEGIVRVDAGQLKASILNRLNSCRSVEGQVNSAIVQGSISTQAEVDAQFAKGVP